MTRASPASVGLFKPPASLARNAARGLRLHEVFGRGGTDLSRKWAERLSRREALTATDAVEIADYFARNTLEKQAKGRAWGDLNDPSAGFIAWLLWGGDEGQAWTARLVARLKSSKPNGSD